MIYHKRQHGIRKQADTDQHQNERRLGEDRQHNRAARSDASVDISAIEPGQNDGERAQRQHHATPEDVAHVG